MRLPDLDLLEELNLSRDERSALAALMALGVADAATLCREGDIASSKIYRAMEKLAELGLVQVQPTRPKQFAALPADAVVDRTVELARERAERFAQGTEGLRRTLTALPARLRGRQTFVDLALGMESHARRHLVHLASASTRILSYMERGDLAAIDQAVAAGFPILRRIARNAAERKIEHRVVFGFSYQSAPILIEFLRRHRAEIRHLTGVRYSGELGHPFHVVDDETVVLPLDHPFVPEGRFASLLVRDRDLAGSLAGGFDMLWHKAMRDVSEVGFQPVPRSD
jgi:sugar-specific transcriptional regulator TrmB